MDKEQPMLDPSRVRQTKWDFRFLYLAQFVANWSKDPSTKVGAVIVRPDNSVVSFGFNGFPRGMHDSAERLADRNEKYPRTVHAELNAIVSAREPLFGCTIYIWPLAPCAPCATTIIQAGIKRVVAPASDNPRWQDSLAMSEAYFKECGVQFDSYVGVQTFE